MLRDWIQASESKTVREVEKMVAGRARGDGPDAPKDPLLERRRLVFELAPDTYAVVQQAIEHLRRDLAPSATNEDVLRAMAEQILGKSRDAEHQPPYQVALTMCAGCSRTWRQAAGEAIEVPASVGDCARCDAEVTGLVAIDEGVEPHVGPPPPAPAITSDAASQDRVAPQLEMTSSDTALAEAVAGIVQRGGWRSLMSAASRLFGDPALRSVTPRLRAQVLRRDRGRCSVPGCRNHRFLDLHHLKPQGRGGPHTLENVTALCSRHHALFHDGWLRIEGTPSTGLRFTDARGTIYGSAPEHGRAVSAPSH